MIDALLYYSQQNEDEYDKVYCEIDILHSVNDELSEMIKEGERVRFTCLKPCTVIRKKTIVRASD